MVVKQDKTTTQPPWDPRLWIVRKVKGTQLHLERDGKLRVRSMDKCKLIKSPESLSASARENSSKENSRKSSRCTASTVSKSVTPVSPELGRQDVDTVNGGSRIQEVVDEEDFDTQVVLQVIRRKT